MKLLRIIRDESFVRFIREVTITKGTEKQDITAHEAPLPSFDKAMQALKEVVVNILDIGNEYKHSMTITAMTISHTKHGTRSVSINFLKTLTATEANHRLNTPMFQIDDSSEGEEGRKQCAKKHGELVAKFIEEAEAYASGERAQQMLPLDDGKSQKAEPQEGDALDFSEAKSD